jgi:hypothetical protein
MGLLERQTDKGPSHEAKVDELHRRFPKARRWIDWWTAADVSSMLFPSRKPQVDDLHEGLPDTTNAQESMHRLYYMIR